MFKFLKPKYYFIRMSPPLLVKAFVDDGFQIQKLENEIKLLEENLKIKNFSNDFKKESNYSKSKGVPGALIE